MGDISAAVRRIERDDAQQAYCCMTEVPTPWPQALCLCRNWVAQNLGKHVEGYHVRLGSGEVVGHLYYALSEQALIPYEIEPGVGVLYCEWIQRQYQDRGLGKQLFETFLADMRHQGVRGVVVEGTDIEGQMYAGHYLSRGFTVICEAGHRKLLYLPINQPTIRARPLEARIKARQGKPVEILIVSGYMCPFETSTLVLLREVLQEFRDQVTLREIMLTPETLREYGVAKGMFINGQQKLGGGETEGAIRQAILEEL